MAVVLDEYAPYDSGPGASVSEAQWRKFMRNVLSGGDGVLRGLADESKVYADSTGMHVKVMTGEYWIQGAWGLNASEKILSIGTAPTADTRKDRVIVRNDFVNNRMELDVLQGVAGTSPTPPTVTRDTAMYEVSLGVVTVGTDVVTIAAGDVTGFAALERSSPFARYRRASGSQTITADIATRVVFPTAVFEDAAVTLNAANDTFTLNRAGIWHIDCSIAWNLENANYGGIRKASITDGNNLGLAFAGNAFPGPPSSIESPVINHTSLTREFNVGQVLSVSVFQTSPFDKQIIGNDTDAAPTKISFAWQGY